MDDLDKYVAERDEREPGFAQLVIDAEKRLAFARKLAERRRFSGKTQTEVAALMKTSASIISRLEAGSDVRVSTLEKYAAAIGMQLDFRATPRRQRSTGMTRAPSKRAPKGGTKPVRRAAAKVSPKPAAKRNTKKR